MIEHTIENAIKKAQEARQRQWGISDYWDERKEGYRDGVASWEHWLTNLLWSVRALKQRHEKEIQDLKDAHTLELFQANFSGIEDENALVAQRIER